MDAEQRQYVRVSTDCHVKYRVIDAENTEALKEDIFDPFSSMEVREIVRNSHGHEKESDRHMMQLLLWLDWKVTYLIKHLAQKGDHAFFPYQAVTVDLSASGMKFEGPKAPPKGTPIQIKLILPILPFKELLLNGEVVHIQKRKTASSQNQTTFQIGIVFQDLKEGDQDDLFRYVVKRERQVRYDNESRRMTVTGNP